MKPLLLLDIDGVILLKKNPGPSGMRFQFGWIDRDIAERLYELGGLYQIVWCTGWEGMANDAISPLFGLGDLPVVPLAKFYKGVSAIPRHPDADDTEFHAACWKLPGVEAFLADSDHPVAWLDDQIGMTDVKRWAQNRPNTKLVQTYPERGLTEREMRMLVDFAKEHRPGFGSPGGLRSRLGE